MYSFESIIRCKLSETRQTLTVISMVLTRILTTLKYLYDCPMTGIRALCQYPGWQHAALVATVATACWLLEFGFPRELFRDLLLTAIGIQLGRHKVLSKALHQRTRVRSELVCSVQRSR